MSETWHGIVHSVVARGIFVVIPRLLGRTQVLGPCLSAVPDLVAGDRVVGAKIGDQLSDLIILCRAGVAGTDMGVYKDADGDITVQQVYLNGTKTEPNRAASQSELTAGLATKAPVAHRHPWADLDDVPATFTPSAHRHPWADLDNVPATFTPSAHDHPATGISDSTATGRALITAADAPTARAVLGAGTSSLALGTTSTTAMAGDTTFSKADVGLGNVNDTADIDKPVSGPVQLALNGKAEASHTHLWAQIQDPPTTYSPSPHGHPIADVTDLQTTLDGKAAIGHTHDDATTSAAGFMSAADKASLDALEDTLVAPLSPAGWTNTGTIAHRLVPGDKRRFEIDIHFKRTGTAVALSTTFVSLGVIIPAEVRAPVDTNVRYMPVWLSMNVHANLFINFYSGEALLRLQTGTASMTTNSFVDYAYTLYVDA